MYGSLLLGITFGLFTALLVCWLGWQLLRQNGRILLRLDELENRLNELEFGGAEEPQGLPPGSAAPAFELADLSAERKSLAQFRGQSVLLIFFNPDCGFCRELAPQLAGVIPHLVPTPISRGEGGRSPGAGSPQWLILTTGDAEQNRQFFAAHKVNCPVLLQTEGEIAKAYQARGTPSGYLLSPDGKIASALAMGAESLLQLAAGNPELDASANADRANRFANRSLANSKIKRDGLKAGTMAPDFRLPRLDGKGELSLSELRGRRVLLVFSSPGCGPCKALAPELEKFHREHPELEVLMITKGEPKENRAKVKEHGLTFPIVLQQQWEISRRYAMFATPIAYLIDENGVIVHDVAVGLDDIKKLLTKASESVGISRSVAAPEPDIRPALAL